MLRLFLSVDIVGSTRFKAERARRDGGAEGWLAVFKTFFTHLPLMLEGEVGLAFLDEDRTPAVDVWKAMGDEIIFAAALERDDDIAPLLLALLRAMRLLGERQFDALPLRLKGAAWTAAFPQPNIEIEIPELSSGEGCYIDYLGPDIDLGFRIGRHARAGGLVGSVDLVERLLGAGGEASVALSVTGREVLKGAGFEHPYPIIRMADAETEAPGPAEDVRAAIEEIRARG
jgi:hypothetical protein